MRKAKIEKHILIVVLLTPSVVMGNANKFIVDL